MNSPMPYPTNPALVIVTVFLGSLIFVTVSKSLRNWGFFEGWTNPLAAVCVTVLCLMGMYQLLDSPHQRADPMPDDARHRRHEDWHLFLFPYALLGILILLILPLLAGGSLFFKDRFQRPDHGDRRRKIQTKQREMDQRRWRE